jgi:hypothetical protein
MRRNFLILIRSKKHLKTVQTYSQNVHLGLELGFKMKIGLVFLKVINERLSDNSVLSAVVHVLLKVL